MFEKKVDVDRHVEFTLKKINSEKERNLRGLAFAKLYYNVGEYEIARRYVSNYLVVKSHSSEAQLMLGKVLEKLGRREEALEAYRTSLDLDPKQNGLVLKVCELLASDDIILEPTRARYWCEQAQLLDPQHPAVFNLRERLVSSQSTSPTDIRNLYLSELEHRPTDVGLRVRLLQHLLLNNQITEAYKHVAEIEQKNLPIFANSLSWYETVAKILVRYRNENSHKNTLTWEFWMLIIAVLDKLVSLSLDENLTNIKNLSDCVTAVFNLDQTLSIAAGNVSSNCVEKQFSHEFLVHFRAQLCFHICTLVFKQAKKDQIKYKEAINMNLPLLLICYHSQPAELQCVWLDHASDQIRKQVQRWHREASFRCSQAAHTLLAIIKERRSTFIDRVTQLCSGLWREKTYKNIFITRDQQMKIKSSYFVNCAQLEDVTMRLPESSELLRYDEIAQLMHPDSLHHMIWLGVNTKPIKFRCTVFDGLQFSVKNLSNCAAETLNILDIQAFLYCCIFCAQSQIEESKHLIYYNHEKPSVLPACITEPLGTINQTKWFSCVYKMFRNESGSDYSNIRVTLIKGIEIVRCAGSHGLDVKLLVMLANTFMEKAKQLNKPSEVEATEARAELYWRNALPLLEKLKNNQTITYPAKRWFDYRGKEMTPTEINMNLEEGKLFSALQLMKKKDHEKALNMLESLKNPYASFYQAQTYKLLADEQMSHNKENVTSEMRSQHIILLSKARDCLYLTLDRLREPSVDRKHPLNTQLGTEIEKIERLLSRIDPDICMNRNECDGLSDENLSSVGSVGEHTNINNSYAMHSSYHNGNMTPRNEHHNLPSTPYRNIDLTMNHSRRAEARPSPERLDAQLRQMAAAKDVVINNVFEQLKALSDSYRTLVDEVRGFKDTVNSLIGSFDELRGVKKTVEELKISADELQNLKEVTEQIYEIKRDLAELKKDTNKLKSGQINEEDLYALEEEYGVEYNINSGATGFNSAALYSNFPQRLQGANTLAYGAPGLYGMYPMYPYGGLGLGQPGTLPFPEGHVPDFRAMGSIAQGLSHAGLAQSQNTLPQPGLPTMFAKLPADANAYAKFDSTSTLPLLTQPPTTQAVQPPTQPVLPTTQTIQPVLPTTQPLLPPTHPILPPTQAVAPITHILPMVTTFPGVAMGSHLTSKAPPVNVVITTSDPLPTTSTSQPILSVTIPPQHLKANQTKNQPHNYQIALPATSQPSFSSVAVVNTLAPMPVSTHNLLSSVAAPVYSSLSVKSPPQNTNKGLGLQIEKSLTQNFVSSPNTIQLNRTIASESSIIEEHDPYPDFKPIIPLPDEVPLTTGEEAEKILFCKHAKLYRYVNKEWRERGIGNIKILFNQKTGQVRILMRRDQVLKICANHFLTPEMILTPMKKNEQAFIWAANDFADEKIILEKLCVRFKTVEEGKKFQEAFEYAKTLLKPESKVGTTVDAKQKIDMKAKVETPIKEKSDAHTSSLGGFVFTSTPTFKPKVDGKTDSPEKQNISTNKPSPFASFTFNASTPETLKTVSLTDKINTEFKPVQKLIESNNVQKEALISPKPVVKPVTVPDGQQKEEGDDFVPTAEFKPVVSLPDLVEVKTGEENAEILYEVKCKLLRYDADAKEWKERGVGIMKILKDKTIRLLMRREQVLKVCCNHQLLKSMVFTNMPRNNKVLNWCAQDFSENVLKPEMFALRFRNAEICEEFLNIITNAQSLLDSSNNVITYAGSSYSTPTKNTQSSWGDKFRQQEDSWECATCYVSNIAKSETCIACETPKNCMLKFYSAQSPQKFKPSPASQPQQSNWGDKFKQKLGTWECKVCYVHNDGKKNYCEACDSPKNDTIPKKDTGVNLNVSGQQFSFGIPANVTTSTPSGGCIDVKATGTTTSSWGDKYKPKAGSWECNVCLISNNPDVLHCVACNSPKDDTVPKREEKGIDLGASGEQKFSFGIPATVTPKPTESIFGAKTKPIAGYTFGMPQTTSPATGFTFVSQKPLPTESSDATPLNLASKPTFNFTLSKSVTEFITPQQDEFVFGSPNKHEFEFKPRSPRKHSGGEGDPESDASGTEEECDNIYFKPAVPLPDKIVVRTGEEEETMLYCHRAKLFRFCDKEWKERGVGDVKILKQQDTGKLRVVMRREQVLKLCLNHCLTEDIEYKPKDERTWLFSAPDYSDSALSYQQFCVRFKNAEIAKEFMQAIENAIKQTCDAPKTDEPKQASTKQDMTKEAPKETAGDDDIEVVYELKVTPEEEEKALKLQLPKNFYSYLRKPPCKGCIGCNDDDFVYDSKEGTTKPTTLITREFKFTPNTGSDKPESKPKSNIFEITPKSSVSSLFGTPTSGMFSGTVSSYATPKSSVSTTSSFSFTPQTSTFSPSVTTETTNTNTPVTNLFSTPKFGGNMLFSSAPNTPKSDLTITSLLTKPALTPPKLNVTPTRNLFDSPQTQNIPNIFRGKATTIEMPTTQDSTKTSQGPAVFGSSSIFGGTKPENTLFASGTTQANIFSTTQTQSNLFSTASSTPPQTMFGGTSNLTSQNRINIFGTNTPTTNIFSGASNTTPKTQASIFGNTNITTTQPPKNIFGGESTTTLPQGQSFNETASSGNVASLFGGAANQTPISGGSIFIAPAQSMFGGGFTQAGKSTEQSTEKVLFQNLDATPSFATLAQQTNTSSAEPVLKCDTNLSFASLASSANKTFVPKEETKSFTFAGAGTPLFGNKKTVTQVEKKAADSPETKDKDKSVTEEGDPQESDIDVTSEDYDPHYEPIVPLPDAIVVKTGEEEEEVMYNERAKLFRYDTNTKEWKERGVGQIKVLRHTVNDTYRLLLRREQVHKLVLNMLITPELELQPMQYSDRAWCWGGYNYSEDGGSPEKLALRFKNAELSEHFHAVILKALQHLSNKQTKKHEEEEQEDYSSDDSDDNRSPMFSKRCTLSYKTKNDQWKVLGMGVIKMFYDSEMYAARIIMHDDSGKELSSTVVGMNTDMTMEDTCCIWRSMERTLEEAVPRVLKAQFSSTMASEEMFYTYYEAKQYAQQFDIVDDLPDEK